MSEPLNADDPRLTAYALGELAADERLLVEQWLAENPAAQAEIDQVRELAVTLTAQLQAEPVPAGSGARVDCGALTQPATAAKRRRAIWKRAAISASAVSVCAVMIWGGRAALHRLGVEPQAVASNVEATRGVAHESGIASKNRLSSLASEQASDHSKPEPEDEPPESVRDEIGDVSESLSAVAESAPSDKNSARWKELSERRSKFLKASGPSKPGRLPPSDAESVRALSTEYAEQGSPAGEPPQTESRSEAMGDRTSHVAKPRPGGKPAPQQPSDGYKAGHVFTLDTLDTLDTPEAGQPGRRPSGGGESQSGDQGQKSGSAQYVPPGIVRHPPMKGMIVKLEKEGVTTLTEEAVGEAKNEKGAPSEKEKDLSQLVDGADPAEGKPDSRFKQMVTPRVIVQEEAREVLARNETEAKYRRRESLRQVEDRTSDDMSLARLQYEAEAYKSLPELPFVVTAENPLSTFGVDVDTASYANVRRFLRQGRMPPVGAVRLEEMLNYFTYEDPTPTDDKPFAVRVETGACPWTPGNKLVRVALRGRDVDREKRPHSNLVFLVDVSGSMQDANKLPLVQSSLQLLVDQLNENDKISIVTYSNEARVALEPTTGNRKDEIKGLIRSLHADGSTNGAGGIQLAYRLAAGNFLSEGTNRVILCTDGDFNVGVSSDDELSKMIAEKAQSGVFLSVFGFGMGNLKDNKLEQLADKGNGQYGYIDDQAEAHKVFVEELFGTLLTIAKDVKLQVEFDTTLVASYRLLGYENRQMAAQEFRNDKKDAGEMGSGHRVTALYEFTPVAVDPAAAKKEPAELEVLAGADKPAAPNLLTVHVRYKQPRADAATEFHVPGPNSSVAPSRDFQWTTAVAAWGLILRNSQFKGQASFDMVQELATASRGEDSNGRRREFVELVALSKAFSQQSETNRKQLGGGDRDPSEPVAPPEKLSDADALKKASVDGKYTRLVEKLTVEKDYVSYGAFNDYGHWTGTSYAGTDRLPEGHWVYVYPNWYIWGDVTK